MAVEGLEESSGGDEESDAGRPNPKRSQQAPIS